MDQAGSGLPTIAIRDIEIQPEENDLVLASFGRGFFILDDYSPLRSVSDELLETNAIDANQERPDLSQSRRRWPEAAGHSREPIFSLPPIRNTE